MGCYNFGVFKKDIRTHPKRNEQQEAQTSAAIDIFVKSQSHPLQRQKVLDFNSAIFLPLTLLFSKTTSYVTPMSAWASNNKNIEEIWKKKHEPHHVLSTHVSGRGHSWYAFCIGFWTATLCPTHCFLPPASSPAPSAWRRHVTRAPSHWAPPLRVALQ